MPVFLLDVNALVALSWSHHEHHVAARRWFDGLGADDRWTTCPITECGFVRVSSIPRFAPQSITPAQAFAAIAQLTTHRAHVFWPDDLPFVLQRHVRPEHLQGHRMITDAYLVALCMHRGGILATFDAGAATIARTAGRPDAAVLIPS